MGLKLTSLIFLISLAGQSFFVFVLQADYQIRYEAYLERCVNRAKPSLKCNGHCQLVLKMKQAEQSQQDEDAPVSVKNPEPLSKLTVDPMILTPQFIFSIAKPLSADAQMLIRARDSVFHPPCIG